jgi:transposase-like protein
MERSHVPLTKWLLATHLMAASKKGMSAHQLARMLDVQYKTAWFLAHRIREAMIDTDAGPLGGTGKTVEADETYFGTQENPTPSPRRRGQPYIKHKRTIRKRAVLALVERQGTARTFHVEAVTADEVRRLIVTNVSRDSALYSDESNLYTRVGAEFSTHQTVKHSAGEYVRGDVHSNTVESYFSVFKRGMKGVYQHCGEKHLQRYLTEFEFRHNRRVALGWTDTVRAASVLKGMEGKRLTYRRSDAALV